MGSNQDGAAGAPINLGNLLAKLHEELQEELPADVVEVLQDVVEEEQLDHMKNSILHAVYKYHGSRDNLAEACDGIFKILEAENLSLSELFRHFITVALYEGERNPYDLPKFGHVLAYSLLNEEESRRKEILDVIALFCGGIVADWSSLKEIWDDISSIWDIVAVVLSNAILPTPDLIQLECDPLTLEDFQGAFDGADEDEQNPNALKNKVIERLAILSERNNGMLRTKRIQNRIFDEVYKYHADKKKLVEACAWIFNIMKAEELCGTKLTLSELFSFFIGAAVEKVSPTFKHQTETHILQEFGHILAFSLLEKKGSERGEILKGIAVYCETIVYLRMSRMCHNISQIWDIVAEVLGNAIRPTPGRLGGPAPTIEDFKSAFLEADKDTQNPNALKDKVEAEVKTLKEEQHEMVAKITRLKNCVVRAVYKYMGDEGKLNEACDEILREHCLFNDLEAEEKKKDRKGSPSLALIFHVFLFAAYSMYMLKRNGTGLAILAKYGHVLARCLLTVVEKEKLERKGRDRILKGIAKYYLDVIKLGADGDFCTFVGEVLSNAILLTPRLLKLWNDVHPTVEDFKDAFVNAANTNQRPGEESLEAAKKNETQKPYALFLQVIKRMAEMHYIREKDGYYKDMGKSQKGNWGVKIDCEWIISDMHVDMDKLIEVLKETKTDFACDLYVILVDSGSLDLTSSDLFDNSLFPNQSTIVTKRIV